MTAQKQRYIENARSVTKSARACKRRLDVVFGMQRCRCHRRCGIVFTLMFTACTRSNDRCSSVHASACLTYEAPFGTWHTAYAAQLHETSPLEHRDQQHDQPRYAAVGPQSGFFSHIHCRIWPESLHQEQHQKLRRDSTLLTCNSSYTWHCSYLWERKHMREDISRRKKKTTTTRRRRRRSSNCSSN